MRTRTESCEFFPSPGSHHLGVKGIRPGSAGERSFAAQRPGGRLSPGGQLVEPLIDEGIDPTQEETGDTGDVIYRVARREPALQAVEKCLGHGPIARRREQQCHIDVDPRTDELTDRRQTRFRAGYFDHDVGTLQLSPETLALRNARGAVVRDVRRHFEAHEAVSTGSIPVELRKQIRGRLDVLDSERLVQRLTRGHGSEPFPHRRGVLRFLHHRCGEDRRIRGHAAESVIGNEMGETAIGEHGASQIVEPDALAQLA